jgi:hypothetical protein
MGQASPMALTLIVISIAPYHRVCTRYFFLTITDSARSDTTFFSRREFFSWFFPFYRAVIIDFFDGSLRLAPFAAN